MKFLDKWMELKIIILGVITKITKEIEMANIIALVNSKLVSVSID